MDAKAIVHHLEQKFSQDILSASEKTAFPFVLVSKNSMMKVLRYCLDDEAMRLDFLESITAVDSGQEFFLVYNLYSTSVGHRFGLKTQLQRHGPSFFSVTELWPAADVYEREIAEMFGIAFEGRTQTARLFLPEDWSGFPMRKDYVFPDEYHGIEHRRDPLRKEHVRP